MVEDTGAAATEPSSASPQSGDPSMAELISRLSEQSSRLVRDELKLAQAEISAKV